jgi:hypothetical protein
MNDPLDDNALDDLLREEPSYIEDAGFTARTLAVLPARRPSSWLRPVLILTVTLVSLAAFVWWLAGDAWRIPASSGPLFSGRDWIDFSLAGVAAIVSIVWGSVAALRSEQ